MPTPLRDNNPDGYPLVLKRVLVEHRLSQNRLRQSVIQPTGRMTGQPISPTTINHIVNFGYFDPGKEQCFKDQIEQAMREHGVPAKALEHIWELDTGAESFTESNPDRAASAKTTARSGPAAEEDPFHLPEPEMLSEAAKKHFGLFRHPFVDDVQGPDDVYLSTDQRYIRESMYYAARYAGFVAVIGESGSGKSTLRRDLVDRIRTNDDQVVVIQPQCIDKRALTAAHICDAIIDDLSQERPKLSLEAKARQIHRILSDSSRAGNAHVLVIEEAHDLHISTLKYLKRFWELEDGFQRLVGIILIGQPELGDRLDERRNYQAREVIRRCEVATLQPLNGNLEDYLTLKFKRIGSDAEKVFASDAFDAIRDRLTRRRPGTQAVESQLYPLNVHNVAIRAMNMAADLGYGQVNAELVRGV